MTEGFRTLELRVDPKTRAAHVSGGLSDLRQGDVVKVLVYGLPGADASKLELWLWESGAARSAGDELAFSDAFTAVTDRPYDFYCDLTVVSDNLTDAFTTAATAPGDYLTCRLILQEGEMPVAETDISVYPNPGCNAPAPTPGDPFIRASDFSGIAAIEAMPVADAADLEAKLNATLALLKGLAP